jgi:hypothetical protein
MRMTKPLTASVNVLSAMIQWQILTQRMCPV